jgi:glycosyltransferase involved in cell wall biosynthesis
MDAILIFLSGANITCGGPLEIYRNILQTLNLKYPNCKVIAIVSNRVLFLDYANVEYIEIKNYKRFILLKFYYEYIRYYYISKKYNIDLWLSLNDCSPTVKAKKKVVYCHNATPFYKRTLKDYLNPTRVFLQSFYYVIFYKINLKRNTFVIVQQRWMKEYFNTRLNVQKSKIIINRFQNNEPFKVIKYCGNFSEKYTFIYPTKAQPYKNIEVILEAADILNQRGISNFKVILTVDKDENRYAQNLYSKYKHLKAIDWVGFLSRSLLDESYEKSNCLIFSSKLETWGLPISEFKGYNKPILLSNLPYAHETVDNYSFCKFFHPDNAHQLSDFMGKLITGNELEFDGAINIEDESSLTSGFSELVSLLLKKN